MANDSKVTWSDAEAREALSRYDGLVKAITRRLRPLASVGRALDEEDLWSEGRIAVLEALRSYQGYGIQESTWVRTRIRQRMIDAIRRLDPRTRDEMRLVVKHAAGETEGDEERRGRLVTARRLVSIDAAGADDEPMSSRMVDDLSLPADEAAHVSEQREALARAMETLPRRQRTALELGLFHGMALKEIGTRMGISESRVCQLQKRAVEQLRDQVAEPETALAA